MAPSASRVSLRRVHPLIVRTLTASALAASAFFNHLALAFGIRSKKGQTEVSCAFFARVNEYETKSKPKRARLDFTKRLAPATRTERYDRLALDAGGVAPPDQYRWKAVSHSRRHSPISR